MSFTIAGEVTGDLPNVRKAGQARLRAQSATEDAGEGGRGRGDGHALLESRVQRRGAKMQGIWLRIPCSRPGVVANNLLVRAPR